MVCAPFSLVLSPQCQHTRSADVSHVLCADGPVHQHSTLAQVWECLTDIHCHVSTETQENVVCVLQKKKQTCGRDLP